MVELRVKMLAGMAPEECFIEARRIAEKLDCFVLFDFNGIECYIAPFIANIPLAVTSIEGKVAELKRRIKEREEQAESKIERDYIEHTIVLRLKKSIIPNRVPSDAEKAQGASWLQCQRCNGTEFRELWRIPMTHNGGYPHPVFNANEDQSTLAAAICMGCNRLSIYDPQRV